MIQYFSDERSVHRKHDAILISISCDFPTRDLANHSILCPNKVKVTCYSRASVTFSNEMNENRDEVISALVKSSLLSYGS